MEAFTAEIITKHYHVTIQHLKIIWVHNERDVNLKIMFDVIDIRCIGSKSDYLHAAERSAVQPHRVEGFLKEPQAATVWLMSDHGAHACHAAMVAECRDSVVNPNPLCQHFLWEEIGENCIVPGQNPCLTAWLSVECCNYIAFLMHAAIFGWYFSRSLRGKST